ncbi:MAG: hypothetical protein AAFX50_20220, partial [Acidobacteriota bacterium]
MMPSPRAAAPRRCPAYPLTVAAPLARAALLAVACAPAPDLLDVPATDAEAFETGVQQQLTDAYAAVDAAGATGERAAAYGELGQVLHAYELRDAAEPAYRNARSLSPDDPAWPYLLGVVLQEKGDLDGAV